MESPLLKSWQRMIDGVQEDRRAAGKEAHEKPEKPVKQADTPALPG